MNKKIVSRFDKHLIPTLPKAAFDGRIIVVQSQAEADKAVDYLLTQGILGFDTETKPSFTKGKRNTVALLQVSSNDTCFLFRLNRIGLTDSILRLLTDEKITKVGLSWHDDVISLTRRKKFTCGPFVELQDVAKDLGITDMSLQKLYANLFGKKISKNQQLSNWETDVYTDAQKLYAATDAWACVQLYEEMERLKETGAYDLEVIPQPEPVCPVKEEKKVEAHKAKKKTVIKKNAKSRNNQRKKKQNVQESVSQKG